jgi:N-acetylmuramoyl-L-alanine amidase
MEKYRRRFLKQIAGLGGIAGVAGLPRLAQAQSTLSAPVRVDDIRLSRHDGYIRLVFALSDNVDHSLFTLHNPERVVLDLKHTNMSHGMVDRVVANDLVSGIRSGIRNGDGLRVVFDLNEAVTPRSFIISPTGGSGYRLVLDLHEPGAATTKTVSKKKQLRDVIVAIDAGHGGKDPGATGKGGVHEKTITLQIARRLEKIVNAQTGMRAVMTRNGDYYLHLRERIAKARDKNADLMISIHADSFPDPRASGSSVYALSVDGASSEAARLLAESENDSDLLFGDVTTNVDDKMVKKVLFDLSLTGTIESSMDVGGELLKYLRSVNRIHKSHVQQAGFAVLKAPNIPAVLLETAFLSNPRDERKLKSPAHQEKIAKAVMRGINDYFSRKAPPGTWLSEAATEYKVKGGDTLGAIASRFNTSASHIRARNALYSDNLDRGQILKIPVS